LQIYKLQSVISKYRLYLASLKIALSLTRFPCRIDRALSSWFACARSITHL